MKTAQCGEILHLINLNPLYSVGYSTATFYPGVHAGLFKCLDYLTEAQSTHINQSNYN